MLTTQLVLVSLAGLVSILFGIRYLLAREFMPYHTVVSGKQWAQLEPGVRTIILGMLKVIAGGLMAYGVALLWLLVPLAARQPWAGWAVLTLTAVSVLPTLYVTLWLKRSAPGARTPVVPSAVVLVVGLVGGALSFLP
jgi:hypothetical protein